MLSSYKAFVNLDHRKDRLVHMQGQLYKAGIEAERVAGLLPHEVDVDPRKTRVMQNRTPGAIGCMLSQMSVMETALEKGKHAFVMEDDLHFCDDFQDRANYISEWMDNNDWDVFWLGGTVHHKPTWWHAERHNHELRQCKCNLGRDMEPTNDKHIIRTYGAFCTYAYVVNVNSIEKVLKQLHDCMHFSIGIDWSFIYLQPNLKTYMFVPGCVKQIDNLSDIGVNPDGTAGMTKFSGFLKLNGTFENSAYVYQDRIEDFNVDNWIW